MMLGGKASAMGVRMGRVVVVMCAVVAPPARALYVGVGKADTTGPPESLVMMGMAKASQTGAGLHTRLYARALIFSDGLHRAAFVSVDGGMIGHVLKKRSVELANLTSYYTMENTVVSGTHSHSGPSGFLQHEIFQFAGSGWVPETIDAMSAGIAKAIRLAHEDLESRKTVMDVGVATSTLHNASINRSPSSYLANPQDERDGYDGDVDSDFVALGVKINDTAVGLATWFAVHPTSMNNTNHLVSSDNKGMASYLAERRYGQQTNDKNFVAAFASANLGDVSPNILGPHCMDTGEPCDFAHSTCPETTPVGIEIQRNEQCAAQGPGADMFESTRIIADRQLQVGADMYDDFLSSSGVFDWTDISTGSVLYRHAYVEMPGLEVRDWKTNETKGVLCQPALGQAFAAGTVDGPGAFDFAQNHTSRNPLWRFLDDVLGAPNASEIDECQAPKAVLIPTGAMSKPHPWAPTVVPFQLVKIGALVIAAVPTEMTTMAGRRLKNMLAEIFFEEGAKIVPVIAGLSNEYADYTTTFEEYQVQRYEGGSTIYGPHQLDALLTEFAKLARSMIQNSAVDPGPDPEDFSDQLDMWPWVKLKMFPKHETPPDGMSFGDVLVDVPATASPGDSVQAAFVGGSLNHDRKTDATYVQVRKLQGDTWATLFTDADPETRLGSLDNSTFRQISVRVDLPLDAQPGLYQLLYHGNAKDRIKGLLAFDAFSSNFTVLTSSSSSSSSSTQIKETQQSNRFPAAALS